jgi:hypothetical protein
MFKNTPSNSRRYPRKTEVNSVGGRLNCLLDEMVRQGHATEAHKILEPILVAALDLLDDNTMSSEIKSLAASFLMVYGEDWTVAFDERTRTRLKELLGE